VHSAIAGFAIGQCLETVLFCWRRSHCSGWRRETTVGYSSQTFASSPTVFRLRPTNWSALNQPRGSTQLPLCRRC